MNVTPMQKVLVADDDAINRQVLGELLKPEYTVIMAKSGAQALEKAAQHGPDLILLDVVMPDMDGYEVLRRLEALLRADDAQADDVLHELQSMLAHSGHDEPLARLRLAVDDIEYPAALAALAELAGALDVRLAEGA